MIYNDGEAEYDTARSPAERYEEDCLNCGESHGNHHGWACDPWYDGVVRFEDLDDNRRFLTQSMKDSITSVAPQRSLKDILREKLGPVPEGASMKHHVTPVEPKAPDLSDWRTWAHKEPGDCPCGIKRAMCTYHK